MKIEGFIYGHNNEPVSATVTIVLPGGDMEMLEILPGNKYVIDYLESELRQATIVFSSVGYKSIQTTGAELLDTGSNIHLEKSNTLFLLLIAAGLFYVLYDKKKKVGALTKQEVIPFIVIAGAVLGFVLIKQLLESLGVWKDKDERQLDTAETNSSLFWSPEYWKSLPPGQSYTRPITLSTAESYATEIHESFNAFNDCEECVKAIFKRLPSQAAASYVSYAFNRGYGMDLLDFLRGGIWPQDRLSDTDVNEINNFVSTLPKY